ncbi:MAG: cysteine desulfurase family protein [Planctomycetota bacterium]
MKVPIYLDNNATTCVDPRALAELLPFFGAQFGNPSSKTHPFGWAADQAVTRAREQIAQAIGAQPAEIIFTGGATEANNLAILGGVAAARRPGRHVITSTVEHKAVLDPCRVLAKRGYDVTFLVPDEYGRVTADAVAAALREDTILISLMAANNEVGTLNPLAEIRRVARANQVLFHTDAAQAMGKVPVDVRELGVDLLATSAHKFYGPKGVGFLYLRTLDPPLRPEPLQFGGGQERGLRPGTLNVPLIVGMGRAAELASGAVLEDEMARLRSLADRLYDGICARVDGVSRNGHPDRRLPGTVNVSFVDVESEALLLALPDVALSSGSACSTGQVEPSHVLVGMGLPAARARSAVRFSVGRFNTEDEIDYTIERVARTVQQLRAR